MDIGEFAVKHECGHIYTHKFVYASKEALNSELEAKTTTYCPECEARIREAFEKNLQFSSTYASCAFKQSGRKGSVLPGFNRVRLTLRYSGYIEVRLNQKRDNCNRFWKIKEHKFNIGEVISQGFYFKDTALLAGRGWAYRFISGDTWHFGETPYTERHVASQIARYRRHLLGRKAKARSHIRRLSEDEEEQYRQHLQRWELRNPSYKRMTESPKTDAMAYRYQLGSPKSRAEFVASRRSMREDYAEEVAMLEQLLQAGDSELLADAVLHKPFATRIEAVKALLRSAFPRLSQEDAESLSKMKEDIRCNQFPPEWFIGNQLGLLIEN